MLNTYNAGTQILTENEDLIFAPNKILAGCPVTHTENSSTIKLNCPGYYYVSFNGDAVATAATETAPIVVTLFNKTLAVPGAEASALSATDDQVVNLSFSTIIKVGPSCCVVDNDGQLTFTNTGADATYTNVSVSVFKLN